LSEGAGMIEILVGVVLTFAGVTVATWYETVAP
jgi:hypothetical protein